MLQERRVVIDNEGKRKMPVLSIESLTETIKAAVKYETKPVDAVEAVVAKAFDEILCV